VNLLEEAKPFFVMNFLFWICLIIWVILQGNLELGHKIPFQGNIIFVAFCHDTAIFQI
jgi:hypothetical protein